MTSDLDNLKLRRSAILTELATWPTAAEGQKVTYRKGDQSFDWTAYRQSLLAELKSLNEQIAAIEGPWEIDVRGTT
jgi:hypothetical protein